jgi:hypothetical protein
MRLARSLCGVLSLALVLAHAPASTHAQGANAGGLAAAPAAGTGASAGGLGTAPASGTAAGPELSAQSIASSIGGGSLGTVQTGEPACAWLVTMCCLICSAQQCSEHSCKLP